jgi:hypothetical protein
MAANIQLEAMPTAEGMAAEMEALHAVVKAELGEDGLPAGGGAEVARTSHAAPQLNPHGRLTCLQVPVKVEVKIEIGLDEVNVEIKSDAPQPDSTHAAISPSETAAYALAEGIADEEGWRRVQPTRSAKRRAVSYADVDSGSDSADEEWTSATAPRRRKAARVMQVTQAGRLTSPEEDVGSWERHLAHVKAYKRKHGDCNVPRSWPEDKQLGTWVTNQRRGKRLLDRGQPSRGMTAARAAKLEGLGFTWELPAAVISTQNSKGAQKDARWQAQLAKLKKYKWKHGDCNVPEKNWPKDPSLGRWVHTQRTAKRRLDCGDPMPQITAARVARLDALGFAWERTQMTSAAPQRRKAARVTHHAGLGRLAPPTEDVGWQVQLASLKAYKERHGDCNVPRSWAEDKRLGTWVMTQRARKRKLDRGEGGMTAVQMAKLEALGFAWQLSAAELGKQNRKVSWSDSGWETKFARLTAYHRKHGDCNVPRTWAEDKPLGNWVHSQRVFKKRPRRGCEMEAARVAKLEALGFAWQISGTQLSKQNREAGQSRDDAVWEAQRLKLEKYNQRHGDCNVPRNWPEDQALGFWVMTQRAGKKALNRGGPSLKITVARMAKLDALGFAWERR